MRNVSSEQVAVAQAVNVYDLARTRLADAFTHEGSSLRLKSDHAVFISAGRDKYFDNASGQPGNAIDLLTRYFGYSFVDAVELLCDFSGTPIPAPAMPARSPQSGLPAETTGPHKQVYAYLIGRSIPAPVIDRLVKLKLLYQDAEHNNAVFVNADRSYAEIRGTYTLGKPFKQSVGSKAGNFWCVPSLETAETVFVCEAAIDAVSLSILRHKAGLTEAVYASIGGVATATVYGYLDDNVYINGTPAQTVKLLVQTSNGPRFILYQTGKTYKPYVVNSIINIRQYKQYFKIIEEKLT